MISFHHQATAVPGIEALPTWPYTEEFKAILGNHTTLVFLQSFACQCVEHKGKEKAATNLFLTKIMKLSPISLIS